LLSMFFGELDNWLANWIFGYHIFWRIGFLAFWSGVLYWICPLTNTKKPKNHQKPKKPSS